MGCVVGFVRSFVRSSFVREVEVVVLAFVFLEREKYRVF